MRFIIILVALLAIAAIVLNGILQRKRVKAGVTGWVKDQDLDGRGKQYYVNTNVGIGCKPDVLQNKCVTEFKSSSPEYKPYPSDILQLTAEMIATGALEGELRYANGKSFIFSVNDSAIKNASVKVINIVANMRKHLADKSFPAAEPAVKKCLTCAFKKECQFSMAPLDTTA
jgi:CRISPR/Cas system-associated exonuclease Cas4 (RecB family)